MVGKRVIRIAGICTLAGLLVLSLGAAAFACESEGHARHLAPGNPTTVEVKNHGSGLQHLSNHPFTGGHVMAQGDRLYVGAYGAGLRIFDISDPSAPEQIGEYLPGVRADAPPDAAVFDGRHIAVLNGTRRTSSSLPGQARTDRTEFLDVTDPADPQLLWTFGPDQVDGESHNGDIVDKRRLYLPSGGVGVQGLRIYDLRPLLRATPAAPENIYRGDPVALWEASPYRQGRPVGAAFTHTHDIQIYVDYPAKRSGRWVERDIALLAEGGNYTSAAGDTGSMFVIDITRPDRPVVLQRWLHERGAGHHPIRYHHEVQFVHGLTRVALVTDEDLHNGCGGAGGVVALKMSADLTSSKELSEWFIPAGTPAPVCSVHVFDSRDGMVYFGSYNAGLQILDYTDPRDPERTDFAIEPGTTAWGALYRRGHVYVGDMVRGLDVFSYHPQSAARPSSTAGGSERISTLRSGPALI
jgi:hypothetical protein